MKHRKPTVPRLRFPEFEGSWQLKTVKDVLEKRSIPVDVQAATEYRQIGLRSHGKGIFHKDAVTGESLGEKRVFWVQPDCLVLNIVFAWEQAVGTTSETECGMVASHRFPMYAARSGLADVSFLFRFFLRKKGRHLLGLASPGGAGRNRTLGQNEFDKLKLTLPTLPEQQKIAAFLTAVDGRIEQLSRKKALLEEYKKGVMQQLFTQALRFQDDHGHDFPDWEQKTLGDVITSLDAGVSVNSEDSPASPTEQGVLKTSCVTKGAFDPNENKRVTDEGERSRLKEPVTANTIIISRMNTPALVGMSGFVRESYPNLFLPDRLWAAKVSPEHSAEWTAHLFGSSMMRSVISSKATGTSGSMKNITKDDVLSIPVQLPSLPEQTKIAGFLSALDGKIAAVGEQMRQTQAWKKGLLQQMFV